MSAPETPASKATYWLAGVLGSALLASITGLAGTTVSHERRITTVETREDDSRQQLNRIERKLDRILHREE